MILLTDVAMNVAKLICGETIFKIFIIWNQSTLDESLLLVHKFLRGFYYCKNKIKKSGKDQESIQSSTTQLAKKTPSEIAKLLCHLLIRKIILQSF